MHEVSLVESIVSEISALSERENFKRVLRIQLEIGALSGVVAESIEFCFPTLSNGTPLEGATLALKKTPLTIQCLACSVQSFPEIYDIQCQRCHSRDFTVVAGKDFKIVDLEVE